MYFGKQITTTTATDHLHGVCDAKGREHGSRATVVTAILTPAETGFSAAASRLPSGITSRLRKGESVTAFLVFVCATRGGQAFGASARGTWCATETEARTVIASKLAARAEYVRK